jgi:serine phosphatase RsbU (regulator of sigma subunit)
LAPGDRLILITDGIIERHTEGGGRFGIDGIREAVAQTTHATAAATAMAILQHVSDCWSEPLADDATVVVLRVD